jgi:hypothetical protein
MGQQLPEVTMRTVGVVLLALMTLGCPRGDKAKQLADQLEREFTSAVGNAGTKADVIAFLQSRKIVYHEEPKMKLITASIPDVEKGTLTKFGVYLKFDFDERDQLRSHEIKALGTGP